MGENKAKRGRLLLLLWFVLFLAGSAEIALQGAAYKQKSINDRNQRLEAGFKKATVLLQERLEKFRFGLQGLAGVYAIERQNPSEEQLKTYAASRDYYENFKGVLGFGFIRVVPEADLPSYEAAQARLRPGFRVSRLPSPPAKREPLSFIIESIEPLSRNRPARGLDVSSEQSRYEAALHAMETGRTTLTRRISLVQNKKDEAGFLLFHPVYRGTRAPPSAEERRRELVGWTYAPVLMSALLFSVSELDGIQLAMRISDLDQRGTTKLFQSNKWESTQQAVSFRSVIHAFERPWSIEAKGVVPLWAPVETVLLYATCTLGILLYGLILSVLRKVVHYWGKAEQKARALEVWQRAIFEGADFGIITTDPIGVVTSMNQSAEQMLGYDAQEVVRKVNFALLHEIPDAAGDARELKTEPAEGVHPGFDAFVARAKHGNLQKTSWTYLRKNGTRFPGQLSMKAIKDERGEHLGFLAIMQDMTERLRAEHDLRQMTEAISRSAIVATTNLDGSILEVNDNFCSASGYERSEIIGQSHRIVNSGAHPKAFFHDLWSTILSGRIWRGEIQNRRKDGQPYWVHSVITPLYTPEGKMDRFLSIRFDISEQKKTEAKLIHSAQLASLGEMSGGIAHEINNPLAMIKGKASVLLMQLEKGSLEPVKLRNDLEKINLVVDRIASIVAGLRAFSRDSAKDVLKEESLEKILGDTFSLCCERFKAHGIELRLPACEGLRVPCRPVQVSQALLNLLSNAHDAVASLEKRWVEVKVWELGSTVRIEVTDSGTGIPAEIVAKMMQPFFTTKDVGKGTGLGLSISKGLIEAQGGRLYYDSASPNTRFVIELSGARRELSGISEAS